MTENNEEYMPNEAFEPVRERIKIEIGQMVQHLDSVYRVVQILNFESIIGMDVITGRSVSLRIGDLRTVTNEIAQSNSLNYDLSDIADDDWKIAEQRFATIKPLINKFTVGRNEAESRAKEVGVNTATIYRWLKLYKSYGVISALIPKRRGWREGNSRISPEMEKIIQQVIQDYYLTTQRPTVQKTVVEVKRRCFETGVEVPCPDTIRYRISKIADIHKLKGRGHQERAKNKYRPAPGSFPNADYPLSVIQIDHTPADIILVDDVYRKPIGRPWLTLAIDVYSRMVTGYYLSFDAPSETSVAMCVSHSILPKEEWLMLHKVDTQWPVWGLPKTIHVDNGPDFRSNTFQQSCFSYDINVEFRPVKQPQYGGHIERLLGTFLRDIHELPGTTFSSVKEREGYDSDKHAAITISEFEAWLIILICKIYHKRMHSALGMTPLRQWEIGIFGNSEITGIGIPPRPTDRMTILLDFLPYFNRTVQTFGVTIDGLSYYAEALRPWINSTDPKTGKKMQLIFRRDPRDISSVWFYDPTLKQYFKIPFADQSLPSMSIWEYNQAKAKLKLEGIASVNEHEIMRAITELRERVEASKEKTKKARRQAQRRKEHEKKITPAKPFHMESDKKAPTPSDLYSGLIDGDINDFGDIA